MSGNWHCNVPFPRYNQNTSISHVKLSHFCCSLYVVVLLGSFTTRARCDDQRLQHMHGTCVPCSRTHDHQYLVVKHPPQPLPVPAGLPLNTQGSRKPSSSCGPIGSSLAESGGVNGAGQATGPPRHIHVCPNFLSRWSRTARVKWRGAPSCWNYMLWSTFNGTSSKSPWSTVRVKKNQVRVTGKITVFYIWVLGHVNIGGHWRLF